MRKAHYRLVMAAAFMAAGCQTTCSPDCLTQATDAQATAGASAGQSCSGVEGLRLVLESVSGDGQSAPVGSAVADPPTVQLLTAFARTPVVGIPVDFAITGGGGGFVTSGGPPIQTITIETDLNGRAAVPSWRLGPQVGANSLTASVDGAPLNASVSGTPVAFGATATAPAAVTIFAGNNQTGLAGSVLPVGILVLVTDAAGRPVQNLTVAFVVTGGGGSVASFATPITGLDGRAGVSWKLGNGVGPNTLSATAAAPGLSGNPASFTATGVAGAAVTLSIQAGDQQTAVAGTAVPVRPAVRLVDQLGNPVPGVQVTFAVASGGGTVQGPVQPTDDAGIATAGGWVLGAVAGANSITATAAGTGIVGSPATFVGTGTAPPPAQIAAFAGNGQIGVTGLAVGIPPAVRVTDANGAPVAGEPVNFQVVAVAGLVVGTVVGASPVTDQNGVAAVGNWILANQAGTNRIQAFALHDLTGNPVTFDATGIAGPPVIFTKASGDNQSAPVNNVPELLPTVRLTDFHGNPVAGVQITFAVTSGGGSITGATVTTDVHGMARVGSWRLGPAAGPNTLTATAGAPNITGNPLTFTATGIVIDGASPR